MPVPPLTPKAPIAWLALSIVLAVIAYTKGLGGPFLFDDDPNIVRNAAVHVTTLEAEDWASLAQSGHSGPLKRPLSMLSFGLNHYLHGLEPFWFKTTNLFIHTLTGLALVLLLQSLLRIPALSDIDTSAGQWICVLVPAVWLLHPFNLNPVLYVVQRMSGLATLFMVLGAIFYTRGRLRLLDGSPAWLRLTALTGLCFALAILSKETGVLLFVYLLVIETVLFGFVTKHPRDRRILTGCWAIAISGSLIAIFIYFYSHPNWAQYAYAFRPFDLGERLLTEVRAILWYLRMVLVPDISQMGLHHDDFVISRSPLDPPTTLLAVTALLFLFVTALVLRRRITLLSFGVLWFLGGHLLESTILPLELVAEHRNYLPSFGMILAAIGLLLTARGLRLSQRWRVSLTVVVTVVLATTTYVRAHNWSSMDSLFAHELANHPHSPRNNYLAGWHVLRETKQINDPELQHSHLKQAEAYFKNALKIEPRMGPAAVALICLHAEYAPDRALQSLHRLQQVLADHPPTRGTIGALEWFTDCAGKYPQHIPSDRYTAIMQTASYSARRSRTRVVDVLSQLARYYGVFANNPKQAEKYTAQALKLRPHNSTLYLTLARWQLLQRKINDAKLSLAMAQKYAHTKHHAADIQRLNQILLELERNPSADIRIQL